MNRFAELENNLNVQFKDYSLLLRALTHRSYLNENPGEALEDNERLEFLGDAVLDFIVGAYLYHRFPEMDEGELTSVLRWCGLIHWPLLPGS
jgi:ribonuclease III